MKKANFRVLVNLFCASLVGLSLGACNNSATHDKFSTQGPADTGGGNLQEISFEGLEGSLAQKIVIEYLAFERVLSRMNRFFEEVNVKAEKERIEEKMQRAENGSAYSKILNLELIDSISKKTNKGLSLRDTYRKLSTPVIETDKACLDSEGEGKDGSAHLENTICISALTLSNKIKLSSSFLDIRGMILHELGHKVKLTEEECQQLERLALITLDLGSIPFTSLYVEPMKDLAMIDSSSNILYANRIANRTVKLLKAEIDKNPIGGILYKIRLNSYIDPTARDRSEYASFWNDIYELNDEESMELSLFVEERLSLSIEERFMESMPEEKFSKADLKELRKEYNRVSEIHESISMIWENFTEELSLENGFIFKGEGETLVSNIYVKDLAEFAFTTASRIRLTEFFIYEKEEKAPVDLCQYFADNLSSSYPTPESCKDKSFILTKNLPMDAEGYREEMLKLNQISKDVLLPYVQRELKLYESLCKMDSDYCSGKEELQGTYEGLYNILLEDYNYIDIDWVE
ncbi:MAG: hypothetical protein VX642_02025 [Bdellovibrionota bacterium]|nr:hypothetical protein [Bdellovibrionota bacterium]